MNKKIVTVFALTSFAIAGTALASYTSIVTKESISFGTSPAITATKTTTATTSITPLSSDNAAAKSETIITASPEATLANVIFKILGIPVTVNEITTLKTYNMGYGEITLAYNLANASGKPVSEILDMRFQQKMGWGKIAKVLGVKLHGAADKSVYILREANLSSDADTFVISIQTDLDDEDKAEEKNKANDKDNDHKEKHYNNGQNHNDKDEQHGNSHKPNKGNGKNN